jgi:hypothetical protein
MCREPARQATQEFAIAGKQLCTAEVNSNCSADADAVVDELQSNNSINYMSFWQEGAPASRGYPSGGFLTSGPSGQQARARYGQTFNKGTCMAGLS